MTDLVERVARAIEPDEAIRGAKMHEPSDFETYKPEAQAALKVVCDALREPSEGMIEAGIKHTTQATRDDVIDVLRALADHLEGK